MKLLKILILLCCGIVLAACNKQNGDTVKVGAISGPETELMETAKIVAKDKYNLDVQIVEFTDYAMPNAALNDGSIDANAFQHQPYLNAEIKNKGYQLVAIGKTFVYPMGIYSKKISNLNKLKDNAVVAIPNDPSNEARALLLLNKAGLITLQPNVDITATPADIASNPKNLTFRELDSALLPRVLPDVAIAVINTNYAIPAGLYPKRDALFIEGTDTPYANLIVVRSEDANNPKLKELVDAFHSARVEHRANELFQGQAIAAW